MTAHCDVGAHSVWRDPPRTRAGWQEYSSVQTWPAHVVVAEESDCFRYHRWISVHFVVAVIIVVEEDLGEQGEDSPVREMISTRRLRVNGR